MATFDLNNFIDQPSVEELEVCCKNDLFLIAQHFEIPVVKTQRKAEIKACISDFLIDKCIFPVTETVVTQAAESLVDAEGSSQVRVGDLTTPGDVVSGEVCPPFSLPKFEPASLSEASPEFHSDWRLKLRLARLQLETQDRAQARQDDLKHQIEMYRIDADMKVRMRELELQAAQTLSKTPVRSINVNGGVDVATAPADASIVVNSVPSDEKPEALIPSRYFDVAKNIALVPCFREKEVEAYFQAFERIATALKWPNEVWALMLQCKLTGKAQEVCASLSVEDSIQYEAMKAAILRAYELVPEHYRQRFRTTKKSASQTYVEFSREKGILFDRWVKACKVTDLNSLRELMLIEEFKNCVPERTALYLNEQKVSTVQQAAVLADEYALMHKTVFKRTGENVLSGHENEKIPENKMWASSSLKSRKECRYCHNLGHIMSECCTLQRKQERQESMQPRGSVLVKTLPFSFIPEPDPCFKPFVFDGFVSLNEGDGGRKSVRILRDTGGSQSFILADALDFCDSTACETSTIIQGIEMGYVTVPLHRVWVTSELASGCFEVAVRASLPVKGIDFIMGNDIAGGKVMPVVQVTNLPSYEKQLDLCAENFPEVFPSVVTTRAQLKCDRSENKCLNDSIFSQILGDDVLPESVVKDQTATSSVRFDLGMDLPVSREALIDAQKGDPTLQKCRTNAEVSSPYRRNCHYVWKDSVLMRKWVSTLSEPENEDDWVYQIVVPSKFRQSVLSLAHDHLWSGHLGINKTYHRVLRHFFWPGLKSDVANYCKSCHVCQVSGKPNQSVPLAPLCPIPAVGEPFERVLVDCVGPLPRAKSGCQYLVTYVRRYSIPRSDSFKEYNC